MSDGRGCGLLARGAGRWALVAIFAVAALSFVSGCPTGSSSGPAPGEACVERYAKCRLPDGPLGVCSDVPCEEGEVEPCLRCVSQH